METIKDKFTKTKSKKKKVKAVHQKVKVFRANDPKMAVFMWGVTHSVRNLQSYQFISSLIMFQNVPRMFCIHLLTNYLYIVS